MSNGIPSYAFKDTEVVHNVRDHVRGTMVEADADEVAGAKPRHVSYDVKFSGTLDDPMAAVMLLSHLRQLLGGPDVDDVSVEVEYEFSSLSKEQLAALQSVVELSWAGYYLAVKKEHRIYERTDGAPPLRRDAAA